jgi:hypothetical protein
MSVRKRKWLDREGRVHQRWMIHIRHKHPDDTVAEIRKVSPVNTKRGAERYERELRAQVLAATAKRDESNAATTATSGKAHENTTIRQFIDIFLREHSKVEGLRPDYIREQQRVLERLVLPTIGDLRLSEIGSQHFSLLKRSMHRGGYSPKTINNGLGVMSKFVQFWWERQELDAPRFKVGLIRLDERDAPVYEPGCELELSGRTRSFQLNAVSFLKPARLNPGCIGILRWAGRSPVDFTLVAEPWLREYTRRTFRSL